MRSLQPTFRRVTLPLLLAASVRLCAVAPQHAAAPASASKPAASRDTAAGIALLHAQHYAEAMNHFEAALTANPHDQPARHGEADAAIAWAAGEVNAARPEHAMLILERAMKQLPDEPRLLVSFGLQAIALNQFPVAEQALHAADRLAPHDPDTTYALARLEIEEQHLPEAERDLKSYLAARPHDASAYFGLGHIYAMEQRDSEARAAFAQSIKLQPRQTESYFQLGQLDLEAHRDADAEHRFTYVLARNPKHAGALTGMGELALRAKNYARAEQLLAAAEQSDPDYPTPHYFRGLALAGLGRGQEAEAEMAKGDSRPHASPPPAEPPQ